MNYPIHKLFLEHGTGPGPADMVAEPGGSGYDSGFDAALQIPEVQMLIGKIGNLPKEKQQEAAEQLLHTVKFWSEEKK